MTNTQLLSYVIQKFLLTFLDPEMNGIASDYFLDLGGCELFAYNVRDGSVTRELRWNDETRINQPGFGCGYGYGGGFGAGNGRGNGSGCGCKYDAGGVANGRPLVPVYGPNVSYGFGNSPGSGYGDGMGNGGGYGFALEKIILEE